MSDIDVPDLKLDLKHWRHRAERAEAALREIVESSVYVVEQQKISNCRLTPEWVRDKALEGLGRKDAEG